MPGTLCPHNGNAQLELHIASKGDDAIEVIGEYVDLTPWIREDILLGLPHHPLCAETCRGLEFQQEEPRKIEADTSPTWDALEEWKQQ